MPSHRRRGATGGRHSAAQARRVGAPPSGRGRRRVRSDRLPVRRRLRRPAALGHGALGGRSSDRVGDLGCHVGRRPRRARARGLPGRPGRHRGLRPAPRRAGVVGRVGGLHPGDRSDGARRPGGVAALGLPVEVRLRRRSDGRDVRGAALAGGARGAGVRCGGVRMPVLHPDGRAGGATGDVPSRTGDRRLRDDRPPHLRRRARRTRGRPAATSRRPGARRQRHRDWIAENTTRRWRSQVATA
jgi:hypothetical protein